MDPDRGASLVGVLVVLVILGALASMAVVALNGDPSGTASRLQDVTPGDEPAGQPRDPTGISSPTSRRRSFADGAAASSCAAAVQTVQAAAAAKSAAGGVQAATVAELVSGGWISEVPALRGYEITLELVGGRPTGMVLVNGLPADRGCSVPPKSGP